MVWSALDDGPLVRPLVRDVGLSFSQAVAASAKGGTVAWDQAGRAVVRREGQSPQAAPPAGFADFFEAYDLAFAPGGRTLAIIDALEGVATWKLGDDQLEGPFGPRKPGEQVAFGADGAMAISDAAGRVRLWDGRHDTPLGRAVLGDRVALWGLASDNRGEMFASAGYDQVIDIWRVAQQRGFRGAGDGGSLLEVPAAVEGEGHLTRTQVDPRYPPPWHFTVSPAFAGNDSARREVRPRPAGRLSV